MSYETRNHFAYEASIQLFKYHSLIINSLPLDIRLESYH
jgi:hypothetical protein